MSSEDGRGLLIDLDGVLYQRERVIAGAPETVAWLQASALPHLFLTNTTSRPRRAICAKLAALGMAVDPDALLTPVLAARRWLQERGMSPVALFVPAATGEDLQELRQLEPAARSGAAAVVLGDLGREWDFDTLNRAFRLLMAEPRPALVALGMTRYWRASDGLRLDVAPFVKALEHASGCRAKVLGKPDPAFYRQALAALGVAPARCVMVGDDIHADVGGAQALGIRGILVKTGKYRDGDLGLGVTPHAVLESIADLPAWWRGGRPSPPGACAA